VSYAVRLFSGAGVINVDVVPRQNNFQPCLPCLMKLSTTGFQMRSKVVRVITCRGSGKTKFLGGFFGSNALKKKGLSLKLQETILSSILVSTDRRYRLRYSFVNSY